MLVYFTCFSELHSWVSVQSRITVLSYLIYVQCFYVRPTTAHFLGRSSLASVLSMGVHIWNVVSCFRFPNIRWTVVWTEMSLVYGCLGDWRDDEERKETEGAMALFCLEERRLQGETYCIQTIKPDEKGQVCWGQAAVGWSVQAPPGVLTLTWCTTGKVKRCWCCLHPGCHSAAIVLESLL